MNKTGTRMSIGPLEPGHDDLNRQLRERLKRLSFPAFAECVRQTLKAAGYVGVETRRAAMKGKNSGGGWDLEATLRGEVSSVRTLVQLRHSGIPVQGRCVDELRGVVLRTGAGEGLIITSGAFSPVAEQTAAASLLAPVRLIDGERLAGLMRRHGVGVIFSDPKPDRWTIDTAYFDALDKHQAGHDIPSSASAVTVIVMVEHTRLARRSFQ